MIRLRRLFEIGPIHYIQMAWFILIELLTIFGKEFSKFELIGPLYLSDFLFILLGLVSGIVVVRKKRIFEIKWIVVLLIVSILYLSYSIIFKIGPVGYIFRHYAIYLYLGISYLTFFSFIDKERNDINLRLLVLISVLSIAIQFAYLIYLMLATPNFDFEGKNYWSPMVIMGVISANAYFITVFKGNNVKRILFILITFILTLSMGHASAFLGAVAIYVAWLLIKIAPKFKLLIAVGFIALMVVFKLALPQFSDQNSSWRLVFWKYVLHELVINNYGVVGEGFGRPYANDELAKMMVQDIGSEWYNYRPEEKYLSPPHNSFLTFAFHTGLISLLFLFLPLKKTAQYIIRPGKKNDKTNFLVLVLIGLSVWSSFNVILELPHSSSFYWLVFFTTIFNVKQDGEV